MKKISTVLVTLLLLTSCVDSLDDYNIDKKRASTIPARTLVTNAMKGLTDILTTPNVNSNNYRMFVQYWATTTYLDEPRYNMTSRLYSQNLWNAIYRDVLADLKEAKRLINADASLTEELRNNQLGIIEILEVYAWRVLVCTFGDVPYSEALNPNNLLPVYDDAQTIFEDLTARLDAALGKLTTTATSFGTADVVYGGNVARWVKFGNTLKLKMGMLLADKNNSKAKIMVEQAASSLSKLLESNAENGKFPYIASSPNNNPISANISAPFTTREDFVIASTIVNQMNSLNDPRRSQYFTQVAGAYVGGNYGFSNAYANYSHVSAKIGAPTFEGMLMEYAEVGFLLAEAIERGFSVPGTAAEHYNSAVTASITYWGGTASDAIAYLAQPLVAYASAPGTYKQKIALQKWIALFNRGWESWVEWRRLDAPTLNPPSGAGITTPLKIPVRMIYPVSEQTLNGAQWEIASGRIGSDSPDAKLFWDIN
ncbi:MAG TPA: SusD/RagB family nutrient-binding outer membrane lipoprotein [Chryseosolibacter sp.]